MEIYVESEYLGLLNLLYELVESVKGTIPSEQRLLSTRDLALKLFYHASSAYVLWRDRTKIPNVAEAAGGADFHDMASVFVLARAAFETYLIFFYVYVEPGIPSDDFDFRYAAWQLTGLLWRKSLNLNPRDTEHIKQLLNEDQQIKDLQKAIQKTQVYQAASAKHQNNLLNAKSWQPQWKDLAKRADIGARLSDTLYSYMSQFAHSTSMSGWQLIAAEQPEPREEMVTFGLFIVEIAMAKLIEDFVTLFPSAQPVFDKHPSRDTTRVIAALAKQMP